MNVLSLFDGMACGMIALQLAGVDVESYDAYEIDKYAIKTAQHNFPMIKEHGNVFDADFTQYEGVDFLIGGSPCTYWSIAQTKNRETVASGMGWELFSQYVRALHEAKPKYFIYENNKSMSKAIRASIDEAFGFEAVLINSALVSAQNRQRLYWVGERNDDGTYSKVNVEQPADRGILLKDVLDSVVYAKSLTDKEMDYMVRDHQERRWNFCNRPGEKDKSKCITANIHKGVPYNVVAEPVNTDANGKAFCVTSRYYKGFGNNPGKCLEKHRDSMVAEPVKVGDVGYAIEFDDNGRPIKAIGKDGKEITIYEVKDGKITIKGKQYPIKLKDGYYIIRKLTVSECKRLQTVPEWYEFCWVETSKQIFGEGVKICKNAKLKDAINLLQTEKLNYAINTTCGSLETEQQNLVENLSITKTNAKPKGATDNSRHLKVTALCTTSVGNDNSRLTNQKSALFVTNQSGTTVATECVLGITLNGCYTETLYLTKNENMNLMEILGVNTTKHLTESGFIELLQKKCLEESSNQKKLFIISTLINWIIAKQTYMSATTKPIFISIDSLSNWQHHSLKMELSSLKMGNIGGVSNSAAYKMLGNGWTCEVICHLINSCFKPADVLPGQIGLWG